MNAVTAPETAALAKESANTLTVAKDFKVADNAGFEQAGAMLNGIMGLRKKIAETFDPHIKRAFEAHRALTAEKKTHETPLVEAEGIYKRAMLGYQQEQERVRREEEARQRAAAEKEAAGIRERAAAAEAKAKAIADELRRKAEEALAAGDAGAAAAFNIKADNKEAAGAEKAANLNIRADTIPTPIVATSTPKVSGVSTRTTYSCKVVDLKKLAHAVGSGTAPLGTIEGNMTILNGLARTLKEGFALPGCELVTTEQMASRAS